MWDVIDAIYSGLIANGTLTAYLAHPAVFIQDSIWLQRLRAQASPHFNAAPSLSLLCNNIKHGVERLECSTVGRRRVAAPRTAGWDRASAGRRPADIVGCPWQAAAAGATLVVLYTGAGGEPGRFGVEIGHWPADAPPAELTL